MKSRRFWPLFLATGPLLAGALTEISAGGFRQTIEATAWTCAELVIAIATTAALGSVGLLATGARITLGLDLAVSRGLELAAALPLVLTCAVAVVVYAWPIPIAVAVIVGTLNGLHSLRVTTVARAKSANDRPTPLRWARRLTSLRHALAVSIAQLVPQVLGLEAATAYLGLIPKTQMAGIGYALGTAATARHQTEIIAWSMISVGVALLTHELLHPSPPPLRQPPREQGSKA